MRACEPPLLTWLRWHRIVPKSAIWLRGSIADANAQQGKQASERCGKVLVLTHYDTVSGLLTELFWYLDSLEVPVVLLSETDPRDHTYP